MSKERLTRFFIAYNPAKVPLVDTILDAYAGHEEELFTALTTKYGPEPANEQRLVQAPLRVDYHSRLTAFFTKYNPEKLPEVDNMLDSCAGCEEEMFTALAKEAAEEDRMRALESTVAALQDAIVQMSDRMSRLEELSEARDANIHPRRSSSGCYKGPVSRPATALSVVNKRIESMTLCQR